MISYSCKYAPLELFSAFGLEPELLDREEENFEVAESLTHANLCCHAKSLIQQSLDKSNVLIMNCCDSLRRVYDVLDFVGKQENLYMLDLPHEDNGCARELFSDTLISLAKQLEKTTGKSFDRNKFYEACSHASWDFPQEDFIALLGGRVSPELEQAVKEQMSLAVVNLTCCGSRGLEPIPEHASELNFDQLMEWYAHALLRMVPCMRMNNIAGRRVLLENPRLKGIVYNTVKFCDFYSFDFSILKDQTSLPILKIESDYMPMASGQLSTRLEAFSESLGLGVSHNSAEKVQTMQGKYFAGIDSGSTTTNMVALDREGQLVASAIVRTGPKAERGAREAFEKICEQLNASEKDFVAIMATGYGRDNIPFATQTKTEISCHAHGAYYLNPQIRTIVDIGGQDSKVICLDEAGEVSNFIMNDKCAAGTGRFLEMMARSLELSMDEMSKRGLTWKKDLTISSMCSVFAESEVISLIADNHSDNDIVHGLNKSIASKTASMVKRAQGQAPFMMTGGVARNAGVVQELETRLGDSLFITEEPDLCGALGAARYAWEELQ
jgi:predicted CoA-substrate-specific enzyme activase